MLQLILGRDWTVNRIEIMKRIAQDVHQRKGNRVLIVPELISHETERRLCKAAGDTSSRYAEVLSFTRLARRVADAMGNAAQECLDNGGRVVAMAATVRQLSSRLKAYAAVETRPEFLSSLIDAIDEFKRCCISSQDLQQAALAAEGSLAQKLEELALLMEGYDALCSRGKRDPRDQMTWLLEQLEEGTFGEEHVFYIDGFPDFTRQNFAIIEHLIQVSPCVTVSLNCDQIDSSLLAFEKAGNTALQLYQCAVYHGIDVNVAVIEDRKGTLQVIREKLFQGSISKGAASDCLKVYRTESAYQECMSAAHQILQLVRSGCRYRDISVVCTDMNTYQPIADLVFQRFHIPLYRTGTEEILQKSVVATVLTALDAAFSGFDQRSTLRYLRSALSPLTPDECDLVENYAVVWGIRGQKWNHSWTNHPDGLSGQWDLQAEQLLVSLNVMRECAINPLAQLRQEFLDATDVRRQVSAVYRFLKEIQLEQRLSDMAQQMDADGDNRNAQILNQLWEILVSALEQMYDVLGETYWETEHFSRLLRLLLSQYDVGTIPPVLDAVHMGAVSAMRCNQQKHLIILGAEEGHLPGYTGSSGVLTDQERVALRNMGVPLTGGAMEGIQAEFAEIYGVFCGAEESVSIYCSGDQPSFVYRRLEAMAGGTTERLPDVGFALADPFEAGAYLAHWDREDLARELRVGEGYQKAVCAKRYVLGTVGAKAMEGLYGKTLNLSASQIDLHAECRLSYFLKYGLRIRERKEATVDPAEFGTYVHAVLENSVRCIQSMGGFQQVSLEETWEIAHRYSDAYVADHFSQLESERLSYLFKRNIQELDMVVQELWMELKDAAFEPVGFEVSFGSEDGLPPIVIPNGAMNAIVRGFIDRVDAWHTQGSSYYRVVDYKTGRKDFDYCDVFNGVGLQMLLYLFALGESGAAFLGNRPIPAGVQYFPARAPYITADGKMDTKDAEKERKAQWRRRGLLLKDETVLQAMEPGETPQRMNYSIRKDGTLTGYLADREQLKLLKRYVFHVLSAMVEDIASGNVDPNPYTRGTSHNACTFCPYGGICHEACIAGRRNYKTMDAQRFWEEVEKEMKYHG